METYCTGEYSLEEHPINEYIRAGNREQFYSYLDKESIDKIKWNIIFEADIFYLEYLVTDNYLGLAGIQQILMSYHLVKIDHVDFLLDFFNNKPMRIIMFNNILTNRQVSKDLVIHLFQREGDMLEDIDIRKITKTQCLLCPDEVFLTIINMTLLDEIDHLILPCVHYNMMDKLKLLVDNYSEHITTRRIPLDKPLIYVRNNFDRMISFMEMIEYLEEHDFSFYVEHNIDGYLGTINKFMNFLNRCYHQK